MSAQNFLMIEDPQKKKWIDVCVICIRSTRKEKINSMCEMVKYQYTINFYE